MRTGAQRLRPVLLTTITTVLGFTDGARDEYYLLARDISMGFPDSGGLNSPLLLLRINVGYTTHSSFNAMYANFGHNFSNFAETLMKNEIVFKDISVFLLFYIE